jgi:hypothetical protein
VAGEVEAAALSVALVAAVAGGLFSKKVSTSLIGLFYASIVLGVIFYTFGDALVGLVEMVTFAGAVSVLVLSVILISGEPALEIGATRLALLLTGVAAVVAVATVYTLLPGSGLGVASFPNDISLNLFAFLWQARPWDLLVLLVVMASSILTVVNLLSKES